MGELQLEVHSDKLKIFKIHNCLIYGRVPKDINYNLLAFL